MSFTVRYLLSCIVLALMFFGGWYFGSHGYEVPLPVPLREAGYDYISPILLCNTSGNPTVIDEPLRLKIMSYIGEHKTQDIAVYYTNPLKNNGFGINENISFSPASMLKVPLMTVLLRKSEKEPGFLEKRVYYDGTFDENMLEKNRPADPIRAQHWYSVSELISAMITQSDNNATRLLHDLLTTKEFQDVYTDLGISAPTVNGPVDFMSAKTYSKFLRILYGSTYLSRENSERSLALMANSQFPGGLRAGVPQGTKVSEKFGERYGAQGAPAELHDCGVIYAKSGPYILCVMTHGDDLGSLTQIISDISRLVYTHVEGK